MKKITLNTAACDNGGIRRASGETLAVGDDPRQLASARAKALIASGMAEDASPPAKPAAKKAD